LLRSRSILLLAALAAASCSHAPSDPDPDRDGDGVPAAADCDDGNPAAYRRVTAYADADGDGVGSGPASTFCTDGSAPAGYALVNGDCAPSDPAAWRRVDLVDRDGDGSTVIDPVAICAGATIPQPYRAVASGNDCDDADPARSRWVVLYRDQDGDGVGGRPRTILCLGEALPSGWSRLGYDVADLDPSRVSDPEDDVLSLVLE
jgi:hypothetical protein